MAILGTGTGFGMEEAGRIIHTSGRMSLAEDDGDILEDARALGRKLVER